MRFEVRPPLVIYRDHQPGNHVMMYRNDERLPYRDDASSFNDDARQYAWAFEGELREGDSVVFITADRNVLGKVHNGQVLIQADSVVGDEPPRPVPMNPEGDEQA